MKRKASNVQENGDCCKGCASFAGVSLVKYGRCGEHRMYDYTVFGEIVEGSERPAIRFNTDWCSEFSKR